MVENVLAHSIASRSNSGPKDRSLPASLYDGSGSKYMDLPLFDGPFRTSVMPRPLTGQCLAETHVVRKDQATPVVLLIRVLLHDG
jgi:hypothetical protein